MKLHPARRVGEAFDEYLTRRTVENQMVRAYFIRAKLDVRPVVPRHRVKRPGQVRRGRLALDRLVAE